MTTFILWALGYVVIAVLVGLIVGAWIRSSHRRRARHGDVDPVAPDETV